MNSTTLHKVSTNKKNTSLSIVSVALMLASVLMAFPAETQAQVLSKKGEYTHADTLRGSYGPARDWWDVKHYDLHVSFNIEAQTISGYNYIQLQTLRAGKRIQIDLQDPLIMDSVFLLSGEDCKTKRERIPSNKIEKEGAAYFLNFDKALLANNCYYLQVFYHGKPRAAVQPPWDGGVVWQQDKQGNPFVTVACQGLGASVWYPCKDHQSDEADSAAISITVPDSVKAVSNGILVSTISNNDGTSTYRWAVTNPINNYNLIPYIGKYAQKEELFMGEKGALPLQYFFLEKNRSAAEKQFAQVPKMLKAFEYWFGPYPFYEDGYKIIEAPHLGMEHQSAIAYGNGYKNGYLGRDLSGTGVGLLFDFIIVHESGHEWWGNNITTKDVADMWVHESFTNYSETLFLEYYYGKDTANIYVQGIRKNIQNDRPIIGIYGVNKEGSGDMYYKGANMIHTIRQIMNEDEKFRAMLRKMNEKFYHQTVTTQEIEKFISSYSGINFSALFDQYLRTTAIPTFTYEVIEGKLRYKYENVVKGYNLPIKIYVGKKPIWLKPTESWKTLADVNEKVTIDKNFYVTSQNML